VTAVADTQERAQARPRGNRAAWRREAASLAALVLLLLCLIPPDGLLSGNEENYFQLAAQSVTPAPPAPDSAVFDSSHHRFLADHLLGWLIAALGYGGAQIAARLLAVLGYALALRALFRRLDLDALDGALVLATFALLGQTLFGGEWLFHGAESKVAAYILVIAGLVPVLSGGTLRRAALLFAAATYFHFLVGLFWFAAALLLRLFGERRERHGAAGAALLFALLVAPLLASIAWSRLAAAPLPPGAPSADVIYSILRLPHHTAPFVEAGRFVAQWLPGCLLAGGMLAACLVFARMPEAARLRPQARWLALLLLYLVPAFAAAALDRHTGALGKFYLFRPASLILLLWLALVLAVLGRLDLPRWRMLRLLALALLLPLFLLHAATRLARDIADSGGGTALAELLARQRSPGGTVLIDPVLEPRFLDVERRSDHPALVLWKFVPTEDAEILEWWRRNRFREAVFAGHCAGAGPYRAAFLVATPEHAARLPPACGATVAQGAGWVLLRRE
jgi:hypothetical protein